jgi:hypothetical protein
VQISGTVSPLPQPSGTGVIVSVTNPNSVLVEAVELPISSSGQFETRFVSGGSNAWVNGTYTVTSNCCGESINSTFYWAPTQHPPSQGPILDILCTVYTRVRNIMFLLCIVLIVFGAAMYSLSHSMPGSHKNSVQNYGLGMMVGATIGMSVALLAPYIFKAVAGSALPIASCASGLLNILI